MEDDKTTLSKLVIKRWLQIFYVVLEFFRSGKPSKCINIFFIFLIPEKKGNLNFSDFKPINLINLINGLYK
jgi:hypothetical protein